MSRRCETCGQKVHNPDWWMDWLIGTLLIVLAPPVIIVQGIYKWHELWREEFPKRQKGPSC